MLARKNIAEEREGQGYDAQEPEMGKVLIVSNNPHERLLLKTLLEDSGFEAVAVGERMEPNSLAGFRASLVLIDISTRRVNTRQTMLLLRSRFTDTPIVGMVQLDHVLTVQEVAFFQTDDLVFKPFRPEELAIRILLLVERNRNVTVEHHNHLLVEHRRRERRRGLTHTSVNNSKRLKPVFRVDSWSRQIFLHEQPCQLSPKEYEFFCMLASYPGRVFADEEIIRRLWPLNRRATGSDVEQLIHRLRKKLKEDPSRPRWILTVKGFGYKLDEPEGVAA